MSYDVSLEQDGKPVKVDQHEEGGTYALGGIEEASLNITYNYSWFYYRYIDKKEGLRWLYGKKAKDCIGILELAVEELGTKQYEVQESGFNLMDKSTHHLKHVDYWAPTPGNAGHALNILLQWAKKYPEAVFSGD